MMHMILALVTQFAIVVRGPDGKSVPYALEQTIKLPTDKYVCTTEADIEDTHHVVSVVCKEQDHKIELSEVCNNDKPDKNVGFLKLDVSKTKTPMYVFFMVGCQTVEKE